MPWSGSAGSKSFSRTDGTRSGANTWQDAEAAAVDIISTDHDTHDQDLATGIDTCLTKDGGNSATANIPFGGNKATGLADPTAAQDAATKAYVDTAAAAVPRGFISGVVPSNGTDAAHDIDFSVGKARDDSDAVTLSLTSAMTKQIDANWTEGSAAGGFPSALTLSANTWYHLFLIGKTDGTTDAGFDTSLTATNLLAGAAGYTLYRRIGSVRTDGSSNIRAFAATEGPGGALLTRWSAFTTDVSTTLGTTPTLFTYQVPSGIKVVGSFRVRASRSGAFASISAWSPDNGATAPSVVSGRSGESSDVGISVQDTLTNTSSQIYMVCDAASTEVEGEAEGWTDFRTA